MSKEIASRETKTYLSVKLSEFYCKWLCLKTVKHFEMVFINLITSLPMLNKYGEYLYAFQELALKPKYMKSEIQK